MKVGLAGLNSLLLVVTVLVSPASGAVLLSAFGSPSLSGDPPTPRTVTVHPEDLREGFMQMEFADLAGTELRGQMVSVDFIFSRPFHVDGGAFWSELFLQTAHHNEQGPNGDFPYTQYVVFGEGSRAYLIDQAGKLLEAPMADWNGGTTDAPATTTGILWTDRGWAGANAIAYPSWGRKVAGIRFDLVLPNTGETLVVGRIAFKINGVAEQGPAQSQGNQGAVSPSEGSNGTSNAASSSSGQTPPGQSGSTHGKALTDPVLPASGVLILPSDFSGFLQTEFTELAGIPMNGQILSIDFMFSRRLHLNGQMLWSEIFLQTGPHNPSNPNGDYPYTQYVVFGEGTRAYLIDQNGRMMDSSMTDWQGGTTNAPASTSGVLLTDKGWAGADMIAYPDSGRKVAGIRFDLVLPNTGQTLVIGRIAVKLDAVADAGDDALYAGNSWISRPPARANSESNSEPAAPPSEGASANEEPPAPPVPEPAPASEEASSNAPGTTADEETPAGESTPIEDSREPDEEKPRDVSPGPDLFAPPEAVASMTGYFVPHFGATSRSTAGDGSLVTGYASLRVDSGSPPAGLAIFRNRQSGLLINEVAVPAAPLVTSGRIYVEISADRRLNTGIAMANPNTDEAAIYFEVRDSVGVLSRSGSFTLRGMYSTCDLNVVCTHVSAFADEAPFLSAKAFEGTLSFTSTRPVSAIAVRTLYNERVPSDFLMTNLPVSELSAAPGEGIQVIPQFSSVDGIKTQIILMNVTGKEIHGRLEFPGTAGSPVLVRSGNQYVNTLPYSLGPNGVWKFTVDATLPEAVSGSIWVIPSGGTPAPVPYAILSYKPGEITMSEATVPAVMGTAFRIYGQIAPSERIGTTIAVANGTSMAGQITFSMTDLEGKFLASHSWALGPFGQMRGSLESIVPALTGLSVQGVLRITTDLAGIAAVGFRERYNGRLPAPDFLFTAIPPAMEKGSPQTRVFPQLPNGDGFTTEIVLYSGTAGETSQGNMIIIKSDGRAFTLGSH